MLDIQIPMCKTVDKKITCFANLWYILDKNDAHIPLLELGYGEHMSILDIHTLNVMVQQSCKRCQQIYPALSTYKILKKY